jgi:enoyl-CoA hydratase/carnithine racemase
MVSNVEARGVLCVKGESMADYTTIRLERQDRVATLWLNRPEVRNALSDTMAREIPQAIGELAADADMHAVILTGAGDVAFCAGADLKEMRARPLSGGDVAWKRRQRGAVLHRCFQSLRDLPKPVVAGVNGYCLGAGLELMASCDLIIASERAQFAMPEIDYAIPSIVEAALLPRMIGILKARELVMTGDVWSAAEALRVGLVNEVVPHAELHQRVGTLARKLAAKSPKAMAVQKDICNQWLDSDLQAAIQHSIYASAIFTGDADHLQSLERWQKRRRQAFQGD